MASIGSNSISNWADSIYSKLDTRNQGYIEKSDLQDALSKVSANGKGSGQSVNVDDTFSALDGDSDGKVTRSELTEAMTKLSDQLNAQRDASRVGRGGPPPGGQPPAGQDGGGASSSASTTDSASSATYIAAADADGDGTVSDAEQAAYDKKMASAQVEGGNASAASTSATDGASSVSAEA